MKIFLLLILLFTPFYAFSLTEPVTTSSGFWNGFTDFFEAILNFIFITIPQFFSDLLVYIVSYALYIKFTLMLGSIEFAFDAATSFLNLVDLNTTITSATSGLPPDLQRAAYDFRFFQCVSLIIEAYIARFIFDLMN